VQTAKTLVEDCNKTPSFWCYSSQEVNESSKLLKENLVYLFIYLFIYLFNYENKKYSIFKKLVKEILWDNMMSLLT